MAQERKAREDQKRAPRQGKQRDSYEPGRTPGSAEGDEEVVDKALRQSEQRPKRS